jgi:exodeoxyribonuclease VII large subunit
MARGWSITRNVKGEVVRSISEVSPGEKVVTTLADGSVTSTVEGVA